MDGRTEGISHRWSAGRCSPGRCSAVPPALSCPPASCSAGLGGRGCAAAAAAAATSGGGRRRLVRPVPVSRAGAAAAAHGSGAPAAAAARTGTRRARRRRAPPPAPPCACASAQPGRSRTGSGGGAERGSHTRECCLPRVRWGLRGSVGKLCLARKRENVKPLDFHLGIAFLRRRSRVPSGGKRIIKCSIAKLKPGVFCPLIIVCIEMYK